MNEKEFKETCDLIDGACNLSGLLHSMLNHIHVLREDYKCGTREINSDGKLKYFVQKIVDLMALPYHDDLYQAAYQAFKDEYLD